MALISDNYSFLFTFQVMDVFNKISELFPGVSGSPWFICPMLFAVSSYWCLSREAMKLALLNYKQLHETLPVIAVYYRLMVTAPLWHTDNNCGWHELNCCHGCYLFAEIVEIVYWCFNVFWGITSAVWFSLIS